MKKLSFTLLAVVAIVLAVVTFVEKYRGTDFVQTFFYGSWWFMLLWLLLAVSSFCYILKQKLQKNISAFLLHISFLVILSGALLTALTARHGNVHVRINDPVTSFIMENGERAALPFTLTLDTFQVVYYPGTNAAADYISRFTVTLPAGKTIPGEVSMNRIFSLAGMRFYQSSYDSDGQGSLLSVNNDRWGIPVTYTGYFLLFLAMLWNLFSPKGYFRRWLGHPLLKKGALFAFFLITAHWASAAGRTLPPDQAAYMGEVQVLYNGRIAPLQTLASDFTLKLTGETSFKTYSCEQVFLGWLLFPASWNEIPMIRVNDAALRNMLGFQEEYVCLKDFFSPQGEYLLDRYLTGSSGKAKKAAAEADEKIQLLTMLHQGELFNVFPVTLGGRTVWYAPTSDLPAELDENQWLFIRKGLGLLNESVLKRDTDQIRFFISKLIAYQQKNGGASLLSGREVKAEIFYNRIPAASLLYKVNLTLGLLAFGCLCYAMLRRKRVGKGWIRLFVGLLGISFSTLTLFLGLRGYVSGRLPMSNGYETMLLLAWSVMLVTILFCRKFRFVVPFGFLLSGFCMLVASLGQMNPQITPLMPVLSSPLLSLHVSLIMMSYALFSFTCLNGILALIVSSGRETDSVKMLQVLSRVLLLPALFLLGAGIFVGAIWANVSWGRYWAWDPKEVWALITFLVYAFALHEGSLPCFGRPLFFHIYLILSFLTILMTYFGVNYFFGGMHSYA